MGIAERSPARRSGLFCATIDARKGSRPGSQIHGTGNAGSVAASGTDAGGRRSRFRGETHSEAISYCIKVSGTADGGNEVAAEPKPATKRRLRSGVASPQPEQPPLAT